MIKHNLPVASVQTENQTEDSARRSSTFRRAFERKPAQNNSDPRVNEANLQLAEAEPAHGFLGAISLLVAREHGRPARHQGTSHEDAVLRVSLNKSCQVALIPGVYLCTEHLTYRSLGRLFGAGAGGQPNEKKCATEQPADDPKPAMHTL